MLKLFLKEYLNFSKKERTGIFVLLTLIILLIIAPLFFPFFIHPKKYDHHQFENEIAALELMQDDNTTTVKWKKNFSPSYYDPSVKKYEHSTAALFDFDPNTLSGDGWKRLGLKDRTIQTIQKYLSKGGKFKKAEDINKIWGLHPQDVQRLLPYVKIKERYSEYQSKQPYTKEFTAKGSINKNSVIDINTADTTAFISLPGIGSKLAGRIITFREKLGGFYKIEQVAETFGLPDSTYQQIKNRLMLTGSAVKQLNINNATVEEMKAHPYLRYAIANAIIQYRSQHGNFNAITDIKKILLVTEEIFNKIAPYLKIE